MSIKTYFRDAVTELHRVTWPTRAQAVRISMIVLGVTFFFALVFGIFDKILAWAYLELLNFAQTF